MNKTEKLYFKDAYLSAFSARVLSVAEVEGGYEVVLDKTAFFPREAGQSADTGKLAGANVLDVYEREGVIYHLTDKLPPVGESVRGEIDFDIRFEKMQCHTAEHLLSGLLYEHYGVDNVGFHLGEYEVTFDTSRRMSAEELMKIEAEANAVIYKNLPVSAKIYDCEEAIGSHYRSKRAIAEQVRIVTILGVDSCACCAPHVARTGEIGIIKILREQSYKGGSRICMLAGKRAYDFITKLYKTAQNASSALSYPILEIADGIARRDEEIKELKLALRESERSRLLAGIPTLSQRGRQVIFADTDDASLARECANLLLEKADELAVVLYRAGAGVGFVMLGREDVGAICKKATLALGGRGGGRGPMAQGSFSSDISEIIEYFNS
ncbi:MAG: alanyl-tRNA editing protein [Clostridia bacterium]|nr:alanyl-tRNA editing protein [Clostridia bacterium]